MDHTTALEYTVTAALIFVHLEKTRHRMRGLVSRVLRMLKAQMICQRLQLIRYNEKHRMNVEKWKRSVQDHALIENSKHSHGRYITIFEKMHINHCCSPSVHFYTFIMCF